MLRYNFVYKMPNSFVYFANKIWYSRKWEKYILAFVILMGMTFTVPGVCKSVFFGIASAWGQGRHAPFRRLRADCTQMFAINFVLALTLTLPAAFRGSLSPISLWFSSAFSESV